MALKTLIIIPARMASKRLPGKPLAMIAGQSMLSRVVDIANVAATETENTSVLVAADDSQIYAHCKEIGVAFAKTDPACPSGTDRVAEAVAQSNDTPDFILNLQGDAPLTPPDFLTEMIKAFAADPCDIVTPVTQMSWEALDTLRKNKETTPFSGTTATFDTKTGKAFWFSKNIIPAIRKEEALRETMDNSPVFRHIGLYGYAPNSLEKYRTLPAGTFEKLEGLEQLRALENGFDIRCVRVDYKGRASMSGVDSPEDITRAEALIAKHGELISSDKKAA